jgi:uncharacterized protein
MGRILTSRDVEFAVKGGSVFACGGGGWADHGRELGTTAVTVGRPELVDIADVPDDAWIATSAAIGAPGGLTDWQMLGVDYVRAVELLQEALGEPIYGLIIGQNGMSSTLNGWLPSALLGTKVIDAVGDLRAHPTGDMGSLGMANSPEETIQSAAGGNRAKNQYMELVVRGATAGVSPVLRRAADQAGGFIASARNPMRASFVREKAALGGISLALELGEAIATAEGAGGAAVIKAICDTCKGDVLVRGTVTAKTLAYTNEAFDVGTITVSDGAKKFVIHVMNEYMAVTEGERRLATYPDVITTLDGNGRPVSAGHVREGDQLSIFHVPKTRIPLSASVFDPSVYPVVEKALGIDIATYALKPV